MTTRVWLYAYLIVMSVLTAFNLVSLLLLSDSPVTAMVSIAVGLPLWAIGSGLIFAVWRLVRSWRRLAAAPLVEARLVGADGDTDLYEYVVAGHAPQPFRHPRRGASPPVLPLRVIPGEGAETPARLRSRGTLVTVGGLVLGGIGLIACALAAIYLPGTALYYVFV
ncbi:hypothetical protein Afil01_67990 [Actinorhabdospora filicis]|uniref:Uncharacterized protein n=1 Tax=Actinorhabdospora filicis TaxID=1785913 RepID=A0A9W6SUC7_9ACTN|nr:hypothetical protein [Actinorhabdospora filicis]GLZ81992.1 hypothetical protein Afil01_67990 [Actinorhabdospora filicis]